MDINQLVTYIIKPALEQIDLWSPASEQLILGTGAKESGYEYLHQIGGGPALGLWQMEPETYHNIWNQFLISKPLRQKVLASSGYAEKPSEDALIYNLKFAAQMCRIRYLWVPHPLPAFNDINGQAAYWAKYYNGNPVTGRVDKYVESYKKYVGNFYG